MVSIWTINPVKNVKIIAKHVLLKQYARIVMKDIIWFLIIVFKTVNTLV